MALSSVIPVEVTRLKRRPVYRMSERDGLPEREARFLEGLFEKMFLLEVDQKKVGLRQKSSQLLTHAEYVQGIAGRQKCDSLK